MDAGTPGSPSSSLEPDSNSANRNRCHDDVIRGRTRDGAVLRDMEISIDSQSFVNLGQLMGSRHGSVSASAGGGRTSTNAAGGGGGGLHVVAHDSSMSVLSDSEGEGLRDFDQIFHPGASEQQQGGSGSPLSSSWSGRELYTRGGGGPGVDHHDDDNDSLLPSLPSRSSTPGMEFALASSNRAVAARWAEQDFAETQRAAAAAAAAASLVEAVGGNSCGSTAARGTTMDSNMNKSSSSTATNTGMAASSISSVEVTALSGGSSCPPPVPFLRDSWLHVPADDDNTDDTGFSAEEVRSSVDADNTTSAAVGSAIDPQQQRYYDAAAAAARARRAAADALAECGECLVHAVDKAAELASPPLRQFARVVNERVEAGVDAYTRGQQAVVKAVDNVPQAPGKSDKKKKMTCGKKCGTDRLYVQELQDMRVPLFYKRKMVLVIGTPNFVIGYIFIIRVSFVRGGIFCFPFPSNEQKYCFTALMYSYDEVFVFR